MEYPLIEKKGFSVDKIYIIFFNEIMQIILSLTISFSCYKFKTENIAIGLSVSTPLINVNDF